MILRSEIKKDNLNCDSFFTNADQKSQPSTDIHEEKHDSTQLTIEKVQKKKKIFKNKMKKVKFETQRIIDSIDTQDNIFLTHGLSISSKGIIRFCYSLNHFSFGYSNYQACRSNYLKNNDIIEFQIFNENKFKQYSFNDAIKFMSRNSCKDFIQNSNTLKSFLDYQKQTFDINFSEKQFINQIEDKNKYIQLCMEFIEKQAKVSDNKIFQYAIGSLNYEKKDFDIFNIGYSKSYLDLLGIDNDNFIRTLLRHQQIDLHQDDEEIMKQSLSGLKTNVYEQFDNDLDFYITTYDGFPLKVQGKKSNIIINSGSKNQPKQKKEFLLLFTEFDVDLKQLQRLIEYRQKLLNNRKDLSYNDFINKELSYMFEDVEYSVHSQSFIEKFYQPNLENLNYLNQQYLKRQIQMHVKQCGYKLLNPRQQQIL
ncbi:hypothetical protein TTHERM_00758890 (macronuclear) [Tetrahymena thermophila SB210]|uniref:Uncharacterized protein n=1 Tax=Tetrahymena thermophila (strain SB210) TaxID=312017 RepID=Q23JL6_TETTS|nr:hypothetical protein TTHERM_00758890 [Tetrahymena thermophila SB210]EAR96727.2 hypothetical protein TTHERM_00758890 [Tetrahymena thermophila SB210]|eukprot:XP_001016972.2 hypothetical protein TTHERM_00758890 [Tetrahymena thermophila SB210]